MILSLIISCITLTLCFGTDFTPVYHIIGNISCTTYQWNIIASGSVILSGVQGSVCSKDAFGTAVGSPYNGRANCTMDSTSGGRGVTVKFCFYNITPADSGVYRVTTGGQQRNGTVFVMNKPTLPQISPTTVETGRQETLTCNSTSTSTPSPTGQTMYYTWTVNNTAISDSRVSMSDNMLTINTVRREDKNNLFQCTAKENQGMSSDTTGIRLTVHYPPQGKPVMSFSTLTYLTGSTVTLSCSITEDGNPQALWTWRCGNRTFNSGITNSEGRSNLTFVVTKTDNNQPCTCTASSSKGPYSQTSDPVTLDIEYPPQGKPVMSFSTLTYLTGSTVTLSCSITEDGNPQALWTWRCGSRTFNSSLTNSVGRSNLTFLVTKTDNNQPCTCTASSSVGPYSQTSDPVTLDIEYSPQGKPVMSYSTLTYLAGNTATLSCSITEDGNPQATWIWRCGSRTFNNGITNFVGRSNMTFVVTKTDNNQPCTCTASSSVGSYNQTSDPAALLIRYPPEGSPQFVNPVLIHNESNTVSLTCALTSNGNPPVSWIWTIGSRNFTSAYITSTGSQSTLRFQINRTENHKICRCRAVSTLVSYDMFSEISLGVKYPPQGKPVMSYSTLTYLAGNTVILSCSITEDGNPLATWMWRCGSRTFYSGVRNSVGRSDLTFIATKTDNNQPCTCTASSSVRSYSQTSDPATLFVRYPPQGKPVISYSTRTYVAGSTVTMSCTIREDGNPQASWTWRCGSRKFTSDITNSVGRSNLIFVVTKTENNQPCTCSASSSVGSYRQTSYPASLIIRYSPQGKPVLTYSTLTYLQGSAVTLSCSLEEDGNPQAKWTWQCGSRTFKDGITYSLGRSNLTFVATTGENNQPCKCTASSSVGSYSQTSNGASLIIIDVDHCTDRVILAGMYFAGFLSSLFIAGIIFSVMYFRRKIFKLLASKKETQNTYDSIQVTAPKEPNMYEDLSIKNQKGSKTENETALDSIQVSAEAEGSKYENLSLNMKEESNVYENT